MKRMIPATGAAVALAVLMGAGLILTQPRARAASDSSGQNLEDMAKIGLDITPVKLNFANKDKRIVGYGSYLVNAVMGCNDCHSKGPDTQYAPGGIPYFGQKPTIVNPATFLGGGRDFGPFPAAGPFPSIISRNLTPNGSGQVIGGFDEFKHILRTGKDPDLVHPTCTGAPNGNCLPAPFDGSLLQIMPWPVYQNLNDFDIRAIYTYLSAIPCIEGGPGEPANRCAH